MSDQDVRNSDPMTFTSTPGRVGKAFRLITKAGFVVWAVFYVVGVMIELSVREWWIRTRSHN